MRVIKANLTELEDKILIDLAKEKHWSVSNYVTELIKKEIRIHKLFNLEYQGDNNGN